MMEVQAGLMKADSVCLTDHDPDTQIHSSHNNKARQPMTSYDSNNFLMQSRNIKKGKEIGENNGCQSICSSQCKLSR